METHSPNIFPGEENTKSEPKDVHSDIIGLAQGHTEMENMDQARYYRGGTRVPDLGLGD